MVVVQFMQCSLHCAMWPVYICKGLLEYPPSKEDKVSNNKINKEETLFPNKMMIPPGLGSEKCLCGNTFESVALENRHPIIHHSRPTKDSRNSDISIHYLETSHCDCKSYYHGQSPQHNRKAKCTLYQWIF